MLSQRTHNATRVLCIGKGREFVEYQNEYFNDNHTVYGRVRVVAALDKRHNSRANGT